MTTEQHDKAFRGNWVRPEIFQLVEDGGLSIQEAWLLLLIDNLVEHGDGGKDCYASNEWLAAKLHLPIRKIQRMLSNIHDTGCLRRTKFDGRTRHLTTAWSRLDLSQQTCHQRHVCPDTSDMSAVSLVSRRKSSKTREKQAKGAKGTQRSAGGIYKRNIQDENQSVRVLRIYPRDESKSFAEKLATTIASVRRINARSKVSRWPQAFRQLSRDGIPTERIRAVLDWYCKLLIRHGDIIAKGNRVQVGGQVVFLPIAYSGEQFRAKFDNLEGCMGRSQADHPNKAKPRVRVSHEVQAGALTRDDLMALDGF